MTGRLFNTFPGGLVPAFYEDMRNAAPRTVVTMPDSPGLFLVKGAPGIDELAEQLELYHYEHKTSDVKDEMVVARINEDLVAALEYGIEELETAPAPLKPQQTMAMPLPNRKTQRSLLGVI